MDNYRLLWLRSCTSPDDGNNPSENGPTSKEIQNENSKRIVMASSTGNDGWEKVKDE